MAEMMRGSIEPATQVAGDDLPLGDTEVYHATSRRVPHHGPNVDDEPSPRVLFDSPR